MVSISGFQPDGVGSSPTRYCSGVTSWVCVGVVSGCVFGTRLVYGLMDKVLRFERKESRFEPW